MVVVARPVSRPRSNAKPSRPFVRYDYVTKARGKKLLDRAARRYFQVSGAEFARQYRAGEIPDPDRAEVIRVAMLMPFAGEERIDG